MKRNPIGYLDGFGIFYTYNNPKTKDFLEAHLGGKVIPVFTKEDLEDTFEKGIDNAPFPHGAEDWRLHKLLDFKAYFKENYEK